MPFQLGLMVGYQFSQEDGWVASQRMSQVHLILVIEAEGTGV